MTFKSAWHRLTRGRWDSSRLASRKFWIVLAFYGGTFPFAYVMTALGMGEAAAIQTAINAVRDVVLGWLGVQGVVDIAKAVTGGKPPEGDV